MLVNKPFDLKAFQTDATGLVRRTDLEAAFDAHDSFGLDALRLCEIYQPNDHALIVLIEESEENTDALARLVTFLFEHTTDYYLSLALIRY